MITQWSDYTSLNSLQFHSKDIEISIKVFKRERERERVYNES